MGDDLRRILVQQTDAPTTYNMPKARKLQTPRINVQQLRPRGDWNWLLTAVKTLRPRCIQRPAIRRMPIRISFRAQHVQSSTCDDIEKSIVQRSFQRRLDIINMFQKQCNFRVIRSKSIRMVPGETEWACIFMFLTPDERRILDIRASMTSILTTPTAMNKDVCRVLRRVLHAETSLINASSLKKLGFTGKVPQPRVEDKQQCNVWIVRNAWDTRAIRAVVEKQTSEIALQIKK